MDAPGKIRKRRRNSLHGLLFWTFFCFSLYPSSSGEMISDRRRAHAQRHLKRLNKPAVMTIQNVELIENLEELTELKPQMSPDGDTIDCVHLSLQPALDHPFLKNHTIQIMPSFNPARINEVKKSEELSAGKSNSISQMWHINGRCPQNTIPIRRTKEEDLLRAESARRYGKKKQRNPPRPTSMDSETISNSGHQHAIAYVQGDKYYGAKATINVWNPKIQQSNEFSLSQFWILGGPLGGDFNSIEAGWQVSPDLYGDNHTRLFIYWTSDAYEATGCYNLLCSGFVQINTEIALGASIFPLSSFHGSQYDISILIWKDPNGGDWWMQFGEDTVVGYWPSSLFSHLADSASMIEWGGEVVNVAENGEHTSTQMGSGHFPEEGFAKASYFRNIQVVDEGNSLKRPDGLSTFTEQSNCYDLRSGDNGEWGSYFYYGGPGRSQSCP